jgi:hypothetical protein
MKITTKRLLICFSLAGGFHPLQAVAEDFESVTETTQELEEIKADLVLRASLLPVGDRIRFLELLEESKLRPLGDSEAHELTLHFSRAKRALFRADTMIG